MADGWILEATQPGVSELDNRSSLRGRAALIGLARATGGKELVDWAGGQVGALVGTTRPLCFRSLFGEIHRIKLTAVSLANTVDVRRWRSVHDGDTVTEACLQTTSSSSEGKLEPRSDGELENRWGVSHLVNFLILW